MGLPVIPKGSDEVIDITLKDADGAAINPNDLDDVIVTIYQTKETPVQVFKLSEDSVTIVGDGSTGQVKVHLDRKNTAKLAEKRLKMEVAIESENTEFEDDTQRQIATDIDLADLKNTVTE